MLSILQAIIDVAVCFGCLKIGRVLVPEAEIFIAGTMFIFFLFSPLYGFKNWTFRDEAKSCFIAVLYSLLVSLFFTYSVGYPVTNTAVGLAMFFPAVIAVRYLFRQMLTASGILNVKFLTFNSGGAREFFTKKINASPFKLRKIRRFSDEVPNNSGTTDGTSSGKTKDVSKHQECRGIDDPEAAITLKNSFELYLRKMYIINSYYDKTDGTDDTHITSASDRIVKTVRNYARSMMT